MGGGMSASLAESDEAFYFACAHGDEAAVASGIEDGANVNHKAADKDQHGATPACACAQEDAAACLRLLLGCRELEIDRPDNWGLTPVHHAAHHGSAECLQLLLASGASPLHRTKDGTTAAALAAAYDHPECLQLLCDFDAAVLRGACNPERETVLEVARRAGSANCEEICVAQLEKMREEAAEEEARQAEAATGTGEPLLASTV